MEYYLSLFIFTFVAGITPGPNNMMLMTSGLNHGIRRSLPHYFGVCLGFPVMVVVVGFGMGLIFVKYPSIFLYIKIAGILYLTFLAWKIANAGKTSSSEAIKKPFSFFQAALFQWLNPKAWTIAIGALAAFTLKDDFGFSVFVIVCFYIFTGLITMAIWLKLGQSLKQFLNTPYKINIFNITMGILLLVSVLPMAFSSINIEAQ